MDIPRHTLSKEERLHGKKDIETLLSKGRFADSHRGIRYCYLTGGDSGLNRIMVSVPKKNFKRAVRRNLLKRRIRESFRLQKHKLNAAGTDILFICSSKEMMSFKDIHEIVGDIIDKVNRS